MLLRAPSCAAQAGGRNVVVDVAGREVDVLDEVRALPGRRVVLALDLDLQRAAEQALDEVVLPNDRRRRAPWSALDARNGDVLAMVSRPTFDPNDFAGRVDTATWKALTSDPWVPLQNRAIQNQFPPGSTFKAFVAAAALHDGVINEHTTVFCPGSYWYGGRAYRCWKKRGARQRRPARGAAQLLRRVLLHGRREARHRPAGGVRDAARPRPPDAASASATRRRA